MPTFTYPASELDRRGNLLALLGSHWQTTYQGASLVESYRYARGQLEVQAYLDLLEAVSSLSRQEVPVFHRENWYLLELLESELTSQPLSYGAGATYSDGYKYGDAARATNFRWELPAGFTAVPAIFNRITTPSVSLIQGVDYTVADGHIDFAANPFNNSLIAIRNVYENGEVVDRAAGLWLYRSQQDLDHIYTHFGYILNLDLVSSESYRDMVNAVMDAFAAGTAANKINLAVAAATGVPVVREAEETVEVVTTDNRHLLVITDAHVYRFHLGDTAAVSVGDTVRVGDFLTTSVSVSELNTGEIPTGVTSLTMEEGLLGYGYLGGLTFQDTDVSTVVTENVQGKTKIEWELGGFPLDVDAFWAEVHSRGVASGVSLANLLDLRGSTAIDEPTAASLPTTVNPLEFLISNLLRFNAFVVQIRTTYAATGAGLDTLRLLRRIVPPWTAMLVLFDMTPDTDVVVLDGTDTQLGISDTQDSFSAGDTQTDTLDLTTIAAESVHIYLVEGACE